MTWKAIAVVAFSTASTFGLCTARAQVPVPGLQPAAQAAAAANASAHAAANDNPAYSADDFFKPSLLPNASYGMQLESATDGPQARVVTTGGEFILDKANDTIECRQRLAKPRTVAKIRLPSGTLQNLSLTSKTGGAAIFTSPGEGKGAVRINGDSLLMMRAGSGGSAVAELAFTPDYHGEFKGNFNFFDPFGGISFFEHGNQPPNKMEAANDPVRVTWTLQAGQSLWAGVSPPKPYDWNKSITQRAVMRGSSNPAYFYPDNFTIRMMGEVAKFNVYYLHNENAMQNWQTELIPRDPAEHIRVMDQSRLAGMQAIVYASPKHFIDGTIVEGRAKDDVDDRRSAGHTSGHNANVYLFEAKRLLERYQTGGFYWDEMYCDPRALATNYWLARATRDLLGDSRPLYFHGTEDVLGDRRGTEIGHTFFPTMHAYFDVVYKGEAVDFTTVDRKFPGYVRYNVGTYNISNAVSVPANLYGEKFTAEMLLDFMRRGNVRWIMHEVDFYNADRAAMWWKHYLPKLTPALKDELEPTLLKPTGVFAEYRRSLNKAAAAR